MIEHEVPTHLQTEDKLLLNLTFPQLAALMAIGASSYAAWHLLPWGMQAKIASIAATALVGVILTVLKVGGRRLPMIAVDIVKYYSRPRYYRGPISHLVRSGPPAVAGPSDGLETSADGLPGKGRYLNRVTKWFRSRGMQLRESRGAKGPMGPSLVTVLALSAIMAALPQLTYADGPMHGESWGPTELEFIPPPDAPGRRIYIEGGAVAEGTLTLIIKAAANAEVYPTAGAADGDRETRTLPQFTLYEGTTRSLKFPLIGNEPWLFLAWQDDRGYRGGFGLTHHQFPYPLPAARASHCDIAFARFAWTRESITGVLRSECPQEVSALVNPATHAGAIEMELPGTVLPHRVGRRSGTMVVSIPEMDITRSDISWTGQEETHFSLPAPRRIGRHQIGVSLETETSLAPAGVRQRGHITVPAWTQVESFEWCGCNCETYDIYHHHPEYIRPGAVTQEDAVTGDPLQEAVEMTVNTFVDREYSPMIYPKP